MNHNVSIVIPTIRSLSFLDKWGDEFLGCSLIVVEDHKTQEIPTPTGKFNQVHHFVWEDISRDFGKDEWIFSRKNAGIRSYGFWKAHQLGADVIITLDDDCYPAEDKLVKKHLNNLNTKAPEKWFSTFPHPDFNYTRGFPYQNRNKYKAVISHGLWSNKMDLDGKTQLRAGNINVPAYPSIRQFVPPGQYFPMSSMNLAFKREVVPLMYFPLMGLDPVGKPWGFDRFDDIWAGIFAKKICDNLGLSVINGSPFVEHCKASDARINIEKEKTGLVVNEWLWRIVDEIKLTKNSVVGCYLELAHKVKFPHQEYFDKLKTAMIIWGNLF
jgi:reversibly glycosylated polypeptide / UDP-arabinopyranose mutase